MAVKKESIEKPCTKNATISSKTAFITKRKMPKVNNIKGKEKRINKGLIIAFTIPNTMLVKKILQKF